MSMFRDSAEFYHLFLSEDSKTANGESVCENGNFSKQSGDAKEYWNSYTFLPTEEIINKDPSDATKVTYEYKKANEEYWKKLRISYDGSATSNGSAYAFDFSSKTLLKQWKTAMSDLTKALAYEPKMRVTKKEYTVLDIEPAAYKDATKKSKIEELLKEKIIRLCPYQEYTNVKKEDITIHLNSMTTAEFIGRQEDIVAKYDFVYIGSCTDNLWMEASQDTSMKNVIYAHVGAMVGATAPKWDSYILYPESSERTYFPGNDITNLKRKALKSFLDTGYPMVIASDLLKDGKADESKFNDTTNNNMYAFINDAIDSKQVLQEDFDYRTYSAEEANKILQSLDMKKPKLEITSYINEAAKNAKISNNGSLSISFNVKDSYDTDSKRTYYIAKMYIDKNADGLYDEKSELFAKSGTFRGNGATVTLKKGLNTTYSGALTWKLEVVKMQNGAETAIKECEVGYNTIKGGAAEIVNVLQIMGDGKTDASTDWAKENAETLNLTTDLAGYIDASVVKADYDLRVKAIHMKEFDDYIEILDNYDILIFGFADSYIDKNLSGAAAEKVQQYIDDGHSVLFTHDLTSQQNNEKFYRDMKLSGMTVIEIDYYTYMYIFN